MEIHIILSVFIIQWSCSLKNILSYDAYQHFLALSITLTILLQSDVEIRSHYLEYSQQLIQQLVYNSKYIYGNTFTVYNIYNLLHLPDTVNIMVVLLTIYHASRLKISCKDWKDLYVENWIHSYKLLSGNWNSKIYLVHLQKYQLVEKIAVFFWQIMLLHLLSMCIMTLTNVKLLKVNI